MCFAVSNAEKILFLMLLRAYFDFLWCALKVDVVFSYVLKGLKIYFFFIPHTEKRHLSTNANSSTITTVGWTKNTPKHDFFEKQKKNHPKHKNQKCLEICQN